MVPSKLPGKLAGLAPSPETEIWKSSGDLAPPTTSLMTISCGSFEFVTVHVFASPYASVTEPSAQSLLKLVLHRPERPRRCRASP